MATTTDQPKLRPGRLRKVLAHVQRDTVVWDNHSGDACIGHYTIVLFGTDHQRERFAPVGMDGDQWPDKKQELAQRLLGLTNSEANELFYLPNSEVPEYVEDLLSGWTRRHG